MSMRERSSAKKQNKKYKIKNAANNEAASWKLSSQLDQLEGPDCQGGTFPFVKDAVNKKNKKKKRKHNSHRHISCRQ